MSDPYAQFRRRFAPGVHRHNSTPLQIREHLLGSHDPGRGDVQGQSCHYAVAAAFNSVGAVRILHEFEHRGDHPEMPLWQP